jgi:hypothetical protein
MAFVHARIIAVIAGLPGQARLPNLGGMKNHVVALILAVASCSPGPAVVPDAATASGLRNDAAPKKIAAYCVANKGRKVGNGECWTLANEAFKYAGAKRPGSDLRVWGRRVDPAKEGLKAGDVIEFQNARLSDNSYITAANHTVVVVEGGPQSHFVIAEQNWGKKTVRFHTLDLTKVSSGKVSVYRP